MSESDEVPCAGCGATEYTALCMCRNADIVTGSIGSASFSEAARALRRLGSEDMRRVVKMLQYRSWSEGYDKGLADGEKLPSPRARKAVRRD